MEFGGTKDSSLELQLGTGFVSRQFHYHAGVATEEHVDNNMLKSSPTTQLVSQIVLSGGRTISYEYDEEERITKIDDSVDGITTYTYDALGQLLTETVNGTVVNTMTYDNYGNILTKNGVEYTYGNESWKDLLTAYNGQAITYDAQGNPTNYMGTALTWKKGRQLKSFGTNTYTYNANGIRTSKTVDGVRHDYVLDGAKILKETWDGNTLIPIYDNEDSVCGIIYNDEPFYFLKNLQGDIIAITDKNGQKVAHYRYDAWGVCTVVSDTSGCNIADINPYRYRGYYYDKETQLYYLQSRYYDPEMGRFVNGDDTRLSGVGKIIEKNLYTYCCNRPNLDIDKTGCVGLSVLMDVVNAILKLFMELAKTAGSMSKEFLNIKKKIERAKITGASKDWIKDLKKKKKSLMSNKSLGTGKLKAVTTVLSFVVTLLTFIPLLKKIKDGIKAIAEIVVEVFVEMIAIIGSAITSLVCKFIPTFGFLLSWAFEFLIDYLIMPIVFDSKRMAKMKTVYSSKVKNGGTLWQWLNAFGYTLKICF